MKLVERHIISHHNPQWKNIDHLCFLSKNLYNSALWYTKKHYEETGKFIRYNDLEKYFKQTNQPDYRSMLIASSQQILMIFDQNIKSFFKLIRKWKKDRKSLLGYPHPPNFKHKIKGRNIFILTYQQFRLENGFICFSPKTKLNTLQTKVEGNIKQIRFIPKSSCYIIEIVYDKEVKELKSGSKYLSIDLGVNNLACCFDNNKQSSFIINGKPLKSINQFYNKNFSKISSLLETNNKKKTSKKLKNLILKRNNKNSDYLHKSSRFVVDYCIKDNIDKVVIGLNKEWKQEVNMHKKDNQNFVMIPFDKFIQMLTYKCYMEGIEVIVREESYTSKCSALDLEELCHHEKYLGRRTKRGLFKSKDGVRINADLNGAMNILRKETGDKVFKEQTLISRGQAMWPVKVNLN
jgi:putative transposase